MTLRTSLLTLLFAASPVVFAVFLWVSAPYGRHTRGGWGPRIASRWGWVWMEAPAAVVFAVAFALGPRALQPAPLALFGLWQLHYLYRAFIYPFRVRSAGKEMPVAVVGMAIAFNGVNGILNGQNAGGSSLYGEDWLLDPRFVGGTLLFLGGLVLNRYADRVLRELRRPGEHDYRIPHGGPYRWVSCPNYLGELIQWSGWAVATWSLEGLAFAVFTAANLVPRALTHHRWYRAHFANYPSERRAILPYVL